MSLTNLTVDVDWESFQHALGKTDFAGFMGAVKYVIQDPNIQKRYADSHDHMLTGPDAHSLEGPDLFFSQSLEQWTGTARVSLADMELQEDGVEVQFVWREGSQVVLQWT